jgi:Ca2+-binding RTX toxin-like protein
MLDTRLLVAIASALGIVAAAPPARAATCTFESGVVTIQLAAAESTTIKGVDGVLTVGGAACAATADVVEAHILGVDGTNEIVWIRLGRFTDVAAIHWTVELGTGKLDSMRLVAPTSGTTLRVGSFADGTHGIDLDKNGEVDVSLVGVEQCVFQGGRGPDVFRATLPPAAGAMPFTGKASFHGNEGDDLLVGGAGRDLLSGGDGSDELRGGDSAAFAERTDDVMNGGAGDDIIHGGPGDDSISGGEGNDSLFGEEGDDYINEGVALEQTTSNGDDLIDGGPGLDMAAYYYRQVSITVDLSLGVGGQAGESDTLASIERALGGVGDDLLIGSDANDWLYGSAGNDVLRGGAGLDRLYCDAGDDSWSDAADQAFDCEHLLP